MSDFKVSEKRRDEFKVKAKQVLEKPITNEQANAIALAYLVRESWEGPGRFSDRSLEFKEYILDAAGFNRKDRYLLFNKEVLGQRSSDIPVSLYRKGNVSRFDFDEVVKAEIREYVIGRAYKAIEPSSSSMALIDDDYLQILKESDGYGTWKAMLSSEAFEELTAYERIGSQVSELREFVERSVLVQ